MFLLAIWFFALATEISADSGAHPDTHIVGGSYVPEGGRPFQVSLDYKGYRFQHFCGGSILNEKWVITAAHCLKSLSEDDITILSGTNSLKNGGKRHEVEEIIVHEKFNKNYIFNYDIALIKIEDKFTFDDKTGNISLANENTGGGVTCVTSGWGYIDEDETETDKMKMLTVKTLTNKDCKESKLKKFQDKVPLTGNQICTYKEPGQGICQGDSGGPLTCNGKLVGLTSYNVPCARGYPDVFTRVYEFRDWVEKNIK